MQTCNHPMSIGPEFLFSIFDIGNLYFLFFFFFFYQSYLLSTAFANHLKEPTFGFIFSIVHLFSSSLICALFFVLGLHPQHMEIPRLGVHWS